MENNITGKKKKKKLDLNILGAVAAQVQEGLEELSHVAGQEGRWWEDTARPR